MRFAFAFGSLLLCANVAHADEPEPEAELSESADPDWLDFDPMVLPGIESLGATEHVDGRTVRFGPFVARLEGAGWSSEDEPWRPELDTHTRGWRTALRISYDLGFARLEGQAAAVDYDDTLSRGRYVEAGLAIVRTFRVSRWMRAWIGISVGRKVWLGDAVEAEPDSTTIGLTLGTTFR